MELLTLPHGRKDRDLQMNLFASTIEALGRKIGFKVSSRGWCYILEEYHLITKGKFNKVETLINNCRKEGYLAIDFVAEEEARGFLGVEFPDTDTPGATIKRWLKAIMTAERYFTPDWWDGEEYYIQMLVEKVDLVTLFKPVCKKYHIPIATSKGWSSMLQRAEYAERFQKAEEKGMKAVLLYCGDHDPDGLRISDFIKKNLSDLRFTHWMSGRCGYDPDNLIIDRFGLNYDFIMDNNLTWIDDLITGSNRNLASPDHKNHHLPYIQEYLSEIGERKCEANALVVRSEMGRQLCREAIEKYLGTDARDRFNERRQQVVEMFTEYRDRIGLEDPVTEALALIQEEEGDEEE